jgi:hypothetical protein
MIHYNSSRAYLIFISTILFVTSTLAQLPDDVKAFQKKYPDERYIRLTDEQLITVNLKNGEFEIDYEIVEEDLYLTNDAHLGSKDSRSFSHFFELNKIEASSFNLVNGKYKEFEVKDFKTKDRLDNSFRDDSKSVTFFYNNLSEGSRSRIEYSIKIKDPRFLPTIFFSEVVPIINKNVVLKIDDQIDIKIIEQNLKMSNVEFQKENKRGYNYYYWKNFNEEAFDYDSQAPSLKRFIPHVIPVITSYRSENGEKVELLNGVKGLYSWYSSLVKNVNTAPSSPELITLVNQITKNESTDLGKVKAIYYWTQENIKYIDFEYALGGFIPREANDVFLKKYGDCKDNSSIMKEMLEVVGIKAHLSWLGTRDIPYDYDTLSSPSVDNHMILTYTDDEKNNYFLDATGRFHPLGLPTSFIQGKQILIENDQENYKLDRIPVVESSVNYRKNDLNVYLNQGELKGSGSESYGGYCKIDVFNTLERIDNSKVKDFFEQELQAGSNKFLIDNWNDWDDFNEYDYENPYEVNYEFHINNYVKTLGDEVYLNLNLNKKALSLRVDKDRKLPIEYDYKQTYESKVAFTIPDHFNVEYIPEDYELKSDLLDVHISYKQEGNKINYIHSITTKYIELNKSQQEEINNMIDQVSVNYKEVISIKKI